MTMLVPVPPPNLQGLIQSPASKRKLPLEPELQSYVLSAVLHHVHHVQGPPRDSEDEEEEEWVDVATEEAALEDIREQLQGREKALQKVLPELLDAMLGNLLAESPDTNRLHYILENSAEFPRMGHHVTQLALFVSDPAKDISQQARAGIYRLYQLLLHQRGLTTHGAEGLWCWDWDQDSRLLGYRNTARVREFGFTLEEAQELQTPDPATRKIPQLGGIDLRSVSSKPPTHAPVTEVLEISLLEQCRSPVIAVFGKFFSEGQRRFFLQTAVLAIHNPLLRVSQAGLVLASSLLGEAQQLMGDMVSRWIRLK
ncbi:unnamed protein product [Caretta caretta]